MHPSGHEVDVQVVAIFCNSCSYQMELREKIQVCVEMLQKKRILKESNDQQRV